MVTRYQKCISGPLLDRIDIHVDVPRVDYEKLSDDRLGEPSVCIRERVERTRAVQRERFVDTPLTTNADMGPAEVRVREACPLDDTSKGLLKAAVTQLHMSARAYHRILKLARTIADLAGSEAIQPAALAGLAHGLRPVPSAPSGQGRRGGSELGMQQIGDRR